MKKLLTLLTFFIACTVHASTYFISLTGNDASGSGTFASPWRTLAKATSTVATPGDIIHVTAGTYLETVQCFLKPGVSLEGDGVTSVIQCTWPWSFQGALVLDSPEGTNGNQSISYLKFDGRNMASPRGIQIQGRSNVSMHHCTVVDFKEEGIIISGTLGYTGAAPGIYATGNSFHDNIVTNCSHFSGYGTGCLGIGGQDGMLVYNNTITQPLRTASYIGWPIKYFNEGWLKGVKIYNNTIIKAPFDGNGYDFCLELFNQSGMEIYGNTIQGALDFNFQTKGSYLYSIYIHDNTIAAPAFNQFTEDGIIVEYGIEGLWVKNNIFRNLSTGVVFYTRANAIIKDIEIEKNLFAGFGLSKSGVGAFIGGFGVGTNAYTIDVLKIHNNTFGGMASNNMNDGVGLGECNSGAIKNVSVRNNHFENITSNVFKAGGSVRPDSIAFTNNNTQGITYNSTPQWSNTPTNYVIGNNISVAPLFIDIVNYVPSSNSPLLTAGSDGKAIGYTGGGGVIIPPPPPTLEPLQVTATNPLDSINGVDPSAISITFNKPIKSATIKLKKGTTTISATVAISGNKISVVSKTTFTLDALYSIQVSSVVATDNTTLSSYSFNIIRSAKIYKR